MIRKGYADCAEGQIHYRTAGPEGAPVIAFFHQTASSGAMWEKVIERLSDRYRCFAFDTPGFGRSYQPDAIPDLAVPAARLKEAIDDLGVDRLHLCGHHTGGCIALELAPLLGERMRTLTLIGPVLVNDAEKDEYRKTFVRPFAIEPSGAFLTTAWEYLRMIGAGSDVDLHNREMADHLIAHRTMPMAFSAVWNQDVEALLRAVDRPLMLMCSKEDVLWPLFERALALRPDAESAVVGGADFQPDRDPDGAADALAGFLTRNADA
jgi:pimeloyl-ACP methyl ester carboxylesterase